MPVCSTDATEHHFTGKEHDAETGNDYFGARYFNSGMGRWLSPDWSAKVAPVPYAKLDDPQTLNLYAYVGNNPMTRFDPDGHQTAEEAQRLDALFQQAQRDNKQNMNQAPQYSGQSWERALQPINDCNSALATAHQDRGAIARAGAAWDVLHAAANAYNIPTALLAATGVRETGFRNVQEVLKNGEPGPGMGFFQLTNQKGVTKEDASNIYFAANFAANMLSSNRSALSSSFPSFTSGQLMQATAASYNFGTGNIRGDPSRIDVGTTGGNYGSNVVHLMSCFPFP